MLEFTLNSPIPEILIAMLLGAFLGLRREMDAQAKKIKGFMGVRTMTMIATMGAISTNVPELPYLPVVFFGALLIFLGIAYANGAINLKRIGMTSELSAIITFWIGVLVGIEQQVMAIILTIFVSIMNGFKEELHRFAKTLTHNEWTGALQLLILSGAVLPFLPRTPIDPWDAIVPFNVWMLVILISGIGFLGYFLTKFFGAKGGIPLTGFLGSIASSTAVTTSMADQSKRSKLSGIFTVGILIGVATMQLRVVAEIYIWGHGHISMLTTVVPVVMAVVSSIFALYFFRNTVKHHNLSSTKSDVQLESPFDLVPALKFGAIFVIVLLALALGQKHLGESGVYAAAVLSGFVDVDAIVLSSLESVRSGTMEATVAQNAISLAVFMNTIIKVLYVAVLGSKKLAKRIAKSLIITCLIGALVLLFL